MKILIVEDHSDMRRMIKKMVALIFTETVEFIECESGEEAVILYGQHQPNCVLMDIQLKDLNGLEATKQIIDLDRNAQIIMVTSCDSPIVRAKAQDLSVASFVSKDNLFALKTSLQTII
ncbi:MAG: response regulator [Bacteroidota bacterium]